MLALLWAPVTSHCLFEKLPGFEFLHCATDTEDSDCTDDACAVVEAGLYKVQDNGDIVPLPTLTLAFLPDVFAGEATVKDSGGEPFRAARPPPHLAPAWQFSYRAAVPVRAPSLA